jgi:hypothetical protein
MLVRSLLSTMDWLGILSFLISCDINLMVISYSQSATSCRRLKSKIAGASAMVIGRRYSLFVYIGSAVSGTITVVTCSG